MQKLMISENFTLEVVFERYAVMRMLYIITMLTMPIVEQEMVNILRQYKIIRHCKQGRKIEDTLKVPYFMCMCVV